MSYFAVIDTETTWSNLMCSVGVVIASKKTLKPIAKKYYVIEETYKLGCMYSIALNLKSKTTIICRRENAIFEIIEALNKYKVKEIFAYNASFDRMHLHELNEYQWFDIMRVAAYKQYNAAIPDTAECFQTGKLKRGFGVESMIRLLTGDCKYYETHNALIDALDELKIIQLLGLPLDTYIPMKN